MSNPDFDAMRQEAEATLRKVLAPAAPADDVLAMVNTESTRAQAMARLDCLCVQWLDQAFQEVDRQARWAELRADIIQRVMERHAPHQMDDGVWICVECRTIYPCKTRTDVAPKEPSR